ncbi:MAG: MBL fold metallo-hydrolase [Dehalococcoidia bacterium]
MTETMSQLELTFLGSGNAFGAEGRAFSSFILNGRYLFDCGPTVLQQFRKAGITSDNIDVVLISHFHADHFFGLPFLFLDAWRNGREKELTIAGPAGIEERVLGLLNIGYSMIPSGIKFPVRYIEVSDGLEAEASGLAFTASTVVHVPELQCYAFRAEIDGRSVVYSGDTTLCEGLTRLVPGADVVVLECSCGHETVHLAPLDVEEVARHTTPGARVILTHLDGHAKDGDLDNFLVADDLSTFCL